MPDLAAGSRPGSSGLRPQRPPRTPLAELLGEADTGAADVVVTGITLDSRFVQSGDLYVALAGASRHGIDFLAEAIAGGAVAVLTDPTGAERLSPESNRAPFPLVVRPDPRAGLGELAARVYGYPSSGRLMFGITGTNGKTTTGHLLAAALRSAGLRTGVIGTLGFSVDEEPLAGPRTTITTPEAPDLQALLAVMAEREAAAVVMEVSSHALALGRADGIVFDVVAFTNFGRDHLDFHGDVESYFEAKATLFTPERARRAVLNLDDPRGRQLATRIGSAIEVVTVSLADQAADYWVLASSPGSDGRLTVSARTPDRDLTFRLGLPGDFNIRNALTALAMIDVLGPDSGLDLDAAAAGLAGAAVPGRMQPVELDPPGPAVVVDFAHTPQAVASVLRALTDRRRIAVLGCGGDRDPDKREPMGAAAVAGAEVVVVTDDNPRSEDPALIRAAMLRGAYDEQDRQRSIGRQVEVHDGGDRRNAIAIALGRAGPDDVVAVLGKGHETGQEIGGQILPFDDRDVVRSVWAELSTTSVSPAPS